MTRCLPDFSSLSPLTSIYINRDRLTISRQCDLKVGSRCERLRSTEKIFPYCDVISAYQQEVGIYYWGIKTVTLTGSRVNISLLLVVHAS